MKSLYLVRHGQTVWNLEGRTQGSKDSSLTYLGLEQAKMLGEALKSVELDAIYCSPLKRASSTTEIIANMKNLDYILDDRLIEMNFGKWEGLTNLEIETGYPDKLKTWRQEPHCAAIPGGETIEVAQRRIVEFVNSRILESDKDTILVVSHGTIIRLLLLDILSMDLSHYYKLKQDNCAINLIEFRHHGPVLIKYNDTCHMDIIR